MEIHFLLVLQVASTRLECQHGWFLLRALSQASQWSSFHCVLTQERDSFLKKDHQLYWIEAQPFITLFNLIYLSFLNLLYLNPIQPYLKLYYLTLITSLIT